jgi:glyoxylase-like metal-dependent hydrolase (beta-lactamase superfamily II)
MTTRISEHVWWCDFQGVNAYLFRDGGTLMLVDAGMTWHASRLERAIAAVADTHVSADTPIAAVDHVVLTHYDIDHVGALSRLDGLDATVFAGSPDASFLTRTERPPWNRKGTIQRALDVLRTTPDVAVETLADGDSVGGLTAYATPGHSPGHMVYLSEQHAVAFLGDLVRTDDGEFQRVPTVFQYDCEQADRSLREFVDRAPPFEIACPGHGTPIVSNGRGRLRAFAEALVDSR